MAKKDFFKPRQSLNIKGRLIDLSTPAVMGILNITPDSFYQGSRSATLKEALSKTEQFLQEGATFIDIGAYSSRPGAIDISPEEELQRLIPVVEQVSRLFPEAVISIDTFRARVAEESIFAGAQLINDISGGDLDPLMFETIGRLQVPYILMHMQGTPQTMQQNPVYEHVTLNVIDQLAKKIARLHHFNVHDMIIDPGFGFGKTLAHNYQLLQELSDLKIFNLPVLVGFSRKGMIHKVLQISPDEALNGTTVLNTIALQKGAAILRVHDVKAAAECIRLTQQLNHSVS